MVHLDSSDTPPPSGHDVLVYELMNICIRRLLNISCACVDPWAYLVIISCTVVVNLFLAGCCHAGDWQAKLVQPVVVRCDAATVHGAAKCHGSHVGAKCHGSLR
jgi:hypothetical protein